MQLGRNLGILSVAALLCAASTTFAEELKIGAKGPDFKLLGVDGNQHTLAAIAAGKDNKPVAATVVVFTCNHCPFAKAYEPVLIDMAKHYADQSVSFVFISSNDPKTVPEDSYENMQARAKEKEYPFPYLFDETQVIAKKYGAMVTPHVFVLDSKLKLRYRGRVNDNKDQSQVTSNDLMSAIDALVAGKPVETASTKAFGCGIKWKKES
jgi:thiol-disulfide isomerase/thioredoxin